MTSVGDKWSTQAIDVDLRVIDIAGREETARDEAVISFIDAEMTVPYDLVAGPLFRATLIRRADTDHLLVLSCHHLISDGWSLGVLKRELGALYSAILAGEDASLSETRQYHEYAEWCEDLRETSEAYWRGLYATPPTLLDLPTDRPRPPVRSFAHGTERTIIEADLVAAVSGLAAAQGVTPFVVYLAAWEILLHKLSGQDSFSSGIFVSGQSAMGARDLTGLCSNHLPLRVSVTPEEPIAEYLRRSRDTTFDAIDHQHYTVGKLASTLRLPRDVSRPRLVSTVITFEKPTAGMAFEGLVAEEPVHGRRSFGVFDIEAYLTESNDALMLDLDYSSDLFERDTITRWLRYYTNLLRAMAADPTAPVSELSLLDETDLQRLAEWNDTAHPYPDQAVVHALFDAQAAATPDRTALLFEGTQMTYAELQQRSNRLAHLLIGKGVTVDVPVGIALPRSPEAIVAMLAVIKAGGAYMPLDPRYPRDRLATMLEDADVGLVLTRADVTGLPSARAELIDVGAFDGDGYPAHVPPVRSTPDDALFITFTSGSTGRPKAVQGTHRGMVNRFSWQWDTYPFAEDEVCCQKTSLNFVDHLWETWGPLLKGCPLLIVPDEVVRDGRRFVDLLAEHEVQRLVTVPSLLSALIRAVPDIGERLHRLRYCTLSGERLTSDLAAELEAVLPDTVLLNFYGMSEGSGDATWYDHRWAAQGGSLPIGRPLYNTRVYLLDGAQALVPIGATGEICVGGVGLATGYRGRPDLTAERFLPDPFSDDPGARMYRSGDFARWRPDGLLEFVGRTDEQVKVRGMRIELGEIEAAARALDLVDDAIVAVATIGEDRQLVAYVVAAEGSAADPSALKESLADKLPDYMVPARVMYLDALPRTPAGKHDRARLPDLDGQRPDLATELVAPRTAAESTLARIWAEVLAIEQVGVHDSFFDLGGDSLLALRCITKANRAGMDLSPVSLFRYQTIAELAAIAAQSEAEADDHDHDQGIVTGPTPLTPAQLRFLTERETPDPQHWNISELAMAERLSPAALRATVEALILHHDALRLRLWLDHGTWRQETAAPPAVVPFQSHDLSGLPPRERTAVIDRTCTELQRSFDLGEGLLLRVAHFDCGPDEPDKLFVTIHHFAVDGMSWSVFWEDLEQAYRQAAAGEPVSLPPKTTAFRTWATELELLAHSSRVTQSVASWLQGPWDRVARLPLDFEASSSANTNASAATVVTELSAADTRRLVESRWRPEHVILAALARMLSTWTSSDTVLIDLLAHGRATALEGVNLSRTVGFILAYHPLLLRPTSWDCLELPDAVVARLQDGPEGLSFDLLRYLAPDPAVRDRFAGLPRAELLFNYAGVQEDPDADALLVPIDDPSAPEAAPTGLRQHPIAVRATLTPNLRIAFVYSRELHQAATIEARVAEVMAFMHELLEGSLVRT